MYVKVIGFIPPDIMVGISDYDTIYFAAVNDCYADEFCSKLADFKTRTTDVYLINWHFSCNATDLLRILNNIN
jgi:hypothetical protein